MKTGLKRAINIGLVILVLISQLGQVAISMVQASKSNEGNNNIEIIHEEGGTAEESIFKVVIGDEVDEVNIQYPEGASFDNTTDQSDSFIATDNREMNVFNVKKLSDVKELRFILRDLGEGENVLKGETFQNGDYISSEQFIFTLSSSDKNVESNEKIINNESLSNEDELVVEEKNAINQNLISPFAGNLNVDIDVSPVNNNILSGNDAAYKLVFKTTGSITEYTNATVNIELPDSEFVTFNQDLSNLKIAGVEPTYNSESNLLSYVFDTLKTGQTYEHVIKLQTENGVTPHETELALKASFEAEEQPKVEDEATVIVGASNSISSSKQFVAVQEGVINVPTPGSETIWKLKVDIPKSETGQLYLEEGSKITVLDNLPEGLIYSSTINGPEPEQVGSELKWIFDAPSLEEQKSSINTLFSTEIDIVLSVENNTVDKTLTNTINSSAHFIGDVQTDVEAKDSITIYDSDEASGEIEGSLYVPVHIGPSNGRGGLGTNAIKNPNPVVYDDALLMFSHGIAPLPESQYGDFDSYTMRYDIDPNLIFKELETPGGFTYRPSSQHPAGIPLKENPKFNIEAIINGERILLIEDAETNRTYNRADLGIDEDASVQAILYDFTYAPAGMLNVGRPNYFFEVMPGYTGTVENSWDVFGVNGAGQSFANQYNSDPLAGLRTAVIAPRPTNQPPITTIGVELEDHQGNYIEPGNNRMRVNIATESSSTLSLANPIETVVLLPLGVEIADNSDIEVIDADGRSTKETGSAAGGSYEVLSDNYNNSGRQLVKFNWNDRLLRPGDTLYSEINVRIDENAPTTLMFDIYGFSGDEELRVPTTNNPTLTDTYLQTDIDDLNNNGNVDQPRLKSGNVYYISGQYNVQTEKLVRGELDEDFSHFGKTVPGGVIDYRLKLTNTTGKNISTMTLIDVMPSDNDLGITDNVDRGSQFTPRLTESIKLPSIWDDKVDVFYSQSMNPERDDLIKNTDYPDSTETLSNPNGSEAPNWMLESEVDDWGAIHSFKIELKEGVEWIVGEDITINFSMKAPEYTDINQSLLDKNINPIERAAWNSFAIATDRGQPVEPSRVGVYMELDNSVQLTKTGEGGETLQGAEFTLLNEDDQEIEIGLTTDENGIITVDDLFPGSYKFIETKAPSGYQLDSTPLAFTIDFAKQPKIELIKENNYSPGSVELTKVGETGELLEGAVFTLVDAAGEELQSGLTTDENGLLIVENLKPGSYAFIETEAPVGYELDATPLEFEIVFNQQERLELNFENPLSPGSVELTKVGETGELLEGAVFTLVDAAGEELQSGLTTDENGLLIVENLKPGSYAFIETEAPFGYELDATPLEFEIVFNQQERLEIEVENDYLPSTVELTKLGEDGQQLEGVIFELQTADGEVLRENLLTNSEGKLRLEDLTPGEYQLVEVETLEGYELDGTPLKFAIGLGETKVLELEFENPLSPGSVELTKVGETGDLLEGAVFTLVDAAGEELQNGLTTDENGLLIVENLKPGSYAFIETEAPFGYELDATPLEFEIVFNQQERLEIEVENDYLPSTVELIKIGEDGQQLEGVIFELQTADGEVLRENILTNSEGKLRLEDLTPGEYQLVEVETLEGYELDSTPLKFTIELGETEVLELDFENPLSPGSVELTKVGETGDLLEGAVFTLVDAAGEELQNGLTTDENGLLIVENLKPGSYAFIETEAPFGYELDATPLEFEIVFNQQERLEIEVENDYLPSTIELTKLGEDGQQLEGVIFELQTTEGEVLRENLLTNSEGKLRLEDLTPGEYQLVEVETLEGYELDATPLKFTIGLGETKVLELDFENPLSPGSVELTKVGETGELLEGAVFTLVDAAGEELQSGLTTDENGLLIVENLKPGNYAFIETEAPFGYELDATPLEFEIVFNQLERLALDFENPLSPGSVELTKVGETGELLEGAVFTLVDAAGEELQSGLTTDENGLLIVENLKPGSYAFIETEAPVGYELNATPLEFEIVFNQQERLALDFENPLSPGSVELTKVGETGELLEGAVFTLVNAAGEELQNGLTTDENGLLIVENLKPGSYAFIETEAPAGYELDATPLEFEIVFNQQERLALDFENPLSPGSVELTKVGETGEFLEGAVFTLVDAAGEELQSGLTTDENGLLIVENLKPGNYAFIETEAPVGYELDATPLEFEIVFNQQERLALDFENPLSPGSVELTKVGETGELLEGAVFTLVDAAGEELQSGLTTDENGLLIVENLKPGNYAFIETEAPVGYELDATPLEFEIVFNQQERLALDFENPLSPGSVELTKVGETGELLEGAVFTLVDAAGEELQSGLTTDENGLLIVENLKPGSYAFIETEAPVGYELDATPLEFEIVFNQLERLEIEVENEYLPSTVELTKLGEDGQQLEGVIFELQTAEGELLRENLLTNSEGKLRLEDLTPGEYQLVEVETLEGYELDATPLKFTIGLGETKVLEIDFENPLSPGSVELTKVGETGELLEGAVFTLVDAAGEELQSGLTTDENGLLVVENLKPGSYAFIETEAPVGYELDATPLEFEIVFNQQERLELDFENPLSPGSVELTKVGETGELLEGAVFTLVDADGEELQSGLTTDEKGLLVVENLKPGSYAFIETEAPFGYKLDATPLEFEIVFNQKERLELEVLNYFKLVSLEITKIDADSGKSLEGATFNILSSNGELITTVTTNEEGKAYVNKLIPGEYQIIETKSPIGYELLEEPISIQLELGETLVKITVENTVIEEPTEPEEPTDPEDPVDSTDSDNGSDLPRAGEVASYTLLALILVSLGFGLRYYGKRPTE